MSLREGGGRCRLAKLGVAHISVRLRPERGSEEATRRSPCRESCRDVVVVAAPEAIITIIIIKIIVVVVVQVAGARRRTVALESFAVTTSHSCGSSCRRIVCLWCCRGGKVMVTLAFVVRRVSYTVIGLLSLAFVATAEGPESHGTWPFRLARRQGGQRFFFLLYLARGGYCERIKTSWSTQ